MLINMHRQIFEMFLQSQRQFCQLSSKPFPWIPKGLHYDKINKGDKPLRKVLAAMDNRKARRKSDSIVLEGHRLIKDAIKSGVIIKGLFFCHFENLQDLPLDKIDSKFYQVKHYQWSEFSSLVTPPGLLALCKMPSSSFEYKSSNQEECIPLTLILDNIRDPGNMGSILRTASAVGCSKIIATKGCVDVWDPKVLRSASGAHFHLSHLHYEMNWDDILTNTSEKSRVYLAENNIQAEKSNSNDSMAPSSEHNNTSTTDLPPSSENSEMMPPGGYNDKEYLRSTLDSRSCYEIDFGLDPVTLVIGGETEGLSAASYEFAHQSSGHCVHIPMRRGIDSLNAGVAASILMFEIKRQYSLLEKINLLNKV